MLPRETKSESPSGIQTLMLLTCEKHSVAIETILDESGFPSWTHMAALQSRRSHFLQDVPRRHPDHCSVFYAFGSAESVRVAAAALAKARAAGTVCPDCVAFSWRANELMQAELELDPVCEQVVDASQSLKYEYEGKDYYFCSPECQHSFMSSPAEHLQG